jgi:hypothetical protein
MALPATKGNENRAMPTGARRGRVMALDGAPSRMPGRASSHRYQVQAEKPVLSTGLFYRFSA